MSTEHDLRLEPVAVVGAGIAGLITAYTLLQDGFSDVQVLTRDSAPGGTWIKERLYPGLYLNNVHGEYRVSPLEMPPPAPGQARLSGDDIHAYLDTFASQFLTGKIQYKIEVRSIRRPPSGKGWHVEVLNLSSGQREIREYARVVLCTGGCNAPKTPDKLAPKAAAAVGFKGLAFHSAEFPSRIDDLLAAAPPTVSEKPGVVVVGGGKSAQDIAAFLANEGRKVTVVTPDFDSFVAGKRELPAFIRKSRVLSLFSPHIHLRTSLERFMHTTWLGKKVVDFLWNDIIESSFKAGGIPKDSPLRHPTSLYWSLRVTDEAVPRPNRFHALVLSGKIAVICPARVAKYGEDGRSVVLEDGTSVQACAVVVATGYGSSWSAMFDEETMEELGLAPRPAASTTHHWDYTTLADAPPLHPDAARWESAIYRGIVPAKHIHRRDIAVNGAVMSSNFGYTLEVTSHWISSYFLGDDMRLPASPEDALAATERDAAWLRQRYPCVPTALSASHTSYVGFWTWSQHVDDLLEDIGLPVMRSGGNALTWPFKVVDLSEIEHLKEERDAKRARTHSS
ncbi:FAD/NAD(P)-binding domain-containing protein [Cerioporus squamosus]|nr:FAD/NAD(P)-binding domain-containing protein [Cerioporus squamosus]